MFRFRIPIVLASVGLLSIAACTATTPTESVNPESAVADRAVAGSSLTVLLANDTRANFTINGVEIAQGSWKRGQPIADQELAMSEELTMTAVAPVTKPIAAQIMLTGVGVPIEISMKKSAQNSLEVSCSPSSRVTCRVSQVDTGSTVNSVFNVAVTGS